MSFIKRSERVADLIRKEISQMLLDSIKDPRIGFVTITRVEVSDDCKMARIYFSVAGTVAERESSIKGLESAKRFVRRELGKRVRLKYIPEIIFMFDSSVEYSIHISEIIEQIKKGFKNNGDTN